MIQIYFLFQLINILFTREQAASEKLDTENAEGTVSEYSTCQPEWLMKDLKWFMEKLSFLLLKDLILI